MTMIYPLTQNMLFMGEEESAARLQNPLAEAYNECYGSKVVNSADLGLNRVSLRSKNNHKTFQIK